MLYYRTEEEMDSATNSWWSPEVLHGKCESVVAIRFDSQPWLEEENLKESEFRRRDIKVSLLSVYAFLHPMFGCEFDIICIWGYRI